MLVVPVAAAYLGGVGSTSVAADSKTFDYTCEALGALEVDMEVEVHGDAPDKVAPGEKFYIENSYTNVTILDTSAMEAVMNELRGEVTKFNLSSNNVDQTIDVAEEEDGLDIPATEFDDSGQITFQVPEKGLKVGPFEAGKEGTIEISAGQIDNILESDAIPVDAVCHPDDEDTVVNTIEIEDDGNGEEDTTAPEITLNGDEEMTLEEGEEYKEPGATAEDNVDGDVSDDIEIDGEVDTDRPGKYEITYTVVDEAGNEATATRTVIVKEKEEEEDTTPPEITLNGDEEMTLEEGEEYEEPGATAEDDVDGDVTDDIKIEGEVDTDKPGEYEITYTVVDEAGNEATATRTVIVEEKEDDEEKALQAVNDTETPKDMRATIEDEELGLNLAAYNKHNTYQQNKIADHMLENRPEDGFADFDAVQDALNKANFELYIDSGAPDDPVEDAFNAVNDADSMDDMQEALENEDLELDLDAYNDLYAYEQTEVANMVLENRPDDDEGYPLPDDIQNALDNAVEELAEGVWFSGEGEPAADLGRNNDLYLDEESFDIYKKEDDEWKEIGNIKGEDGENGEKGEDGVDGVDGATWLVGEGEPAAGKGENGDLYLDTESNDVYLKSEDGWDKVTNIKGEPGEDGRDGEDGSDGQNGADGSNGEDGEDGSDGDDGKDGKGHKNYKKDDQSSGAVTKSDNNNGSGGTLPDTATTNPLFILLGSIMAVGGGALVFIRRKIMG